MLRDVRVFCPTCLGTGTEKCPHCHGEGKREIRLNGQLRGTVPCEFCGGESIQPCSACGGVMGKVSAAT